MTRQNENELRDAVASVCRDFWTRLRKQHPNERFYAFAVYTREEADELEPAACGEDALNKVARRWVNEKLHATLDEARAVLRYGFPETPYRVQRRKECAPVDKVLTKRGSVFDMSGRAARQEVKFRLEAAVKALQMLNKEGLFGTGRARADIMLFIEANDRSDKWMLQYAKKLNPKDIYDAFAKPLQSKVKGRFTGLGKTQDYCQSGSVHLAQDGRSLFSFCDYDAYAFDALKRKQLWSKRPRRSGNVKIWAAGISSDGMMGAAGWEFRGKCGATLWSGKKWANAREIALEAQPVSLVISPAADWLAIADESNAIRLFDATGEPLTILRGHRACPLSLAVTPDGRLLASCDEKSGIRLWNTKDWSLRSRLKRPAHCLSFGYGGRWLSASDMGTSLYDGLPAERRIVTVWNVSKEQVVHEIRGGAQPLTNAVLSPDGKRVVCQIGGGGQPTRAVVLDVPAGAVLAELSVGSDAQHYQDFVFLPDGRTIAVSVSGGSMKPVVLWDTGLGQ